MKDEASYVCDSCGEEIVLPIDLAAGTDQEYVEDCSVCCRPNVIHGETGEHVEICFSVLGIEITTLSPIDLEGEALVGFEKDLRFVVNSCHCLSLVVV